MRQLRRLHFQHNGKTKPLRRIGRVLATLRRLNLEENTLVVYMADHGYCLGHHGRFEKHCGYDQALRVPLIFRWPGKGREGVTIRDLTESIDVPATITDLMGVDALPTAHGQSLRRYVEGGRVAKPRTHIFSEYLENGEGRCVTGSKETRAKPASAQAEAGNIKLVRGAWNEAFLTEVENFPSTNTKDDQVDALSDALDELVGPAAAPRIRGL